MGGKYTVPRAIQTTPKEIGTAVTEQMISENITNKRRIKEITQQQDWDG